MWLLFQHDSGLKFESNESFNFIKKNPIPDDFEFQSTIATEFNLVCDQQYKVIFYFFLFSLLFFKFTNHVTSINDVVIKWFINVLLPLFFYDIFRLIDEISGSQNVELVTQYNQSSRNYINTLLVEDTKQRIDQSYLLFNLILKNLPSWNVYASCNFNGSSNIETGVEYLLCFFYLPKTEKKRVLLIKVFYDQ